jgi:hypothetical protein
MQKSMQETLGRNLEREILFCFAYYTSLNF